MVNYKDYQDYWNKSDSIGVQWQRNKSGSWNNDHWMADGEWMDYFLSSHQELNSLIDIACGSGRLFSLWEKHNLEFEGIEWSDVLFPLVSKYSNSHKIDVRKSSLDRTFDVVFSTQFLLHILPIDIRNTISNMKKMMSKYMIIITWYEEEKIRENGEYSDGITFNSFSHPYGTIFNECKLNIHSVERIRYEEKNVENVVWVLESDLNERKY